MSAPVRYRLVPRNPEAHLYEVDCAIDDPADAGQIFRLPTWIPGSYLIREFARNVTRISAAADGKPVTITKTAKDSWQCAPCAGPLTVTIEVYAWDLSVRGAHLDRTHAFFNGTSVFLSPAGMENRPCAVELLRPAGDRYAGWRLATSLQRVDGPPDGFGTFRAADYDALIDHPVEMGTFAHGTFAAGGVPHEIAITGRTDCDMERLTADVARVCQAHIDFFAAAGDPAPPMDRYVFLTTALADGHGGLEHRASTALITSRRNLPRPGLREPNDDYIDFLGLVSHEYFHTWVVKRIKPAAFVPYDLTREAYTRQLWIFEGFTSYYDNLALVRSGLIGVETYLELLGQDASKVLRGNGRTRQSIAESSFDAWIKYYRQDENAPNAVVSYYVKGALVALLLDLKLRTESSASLDDVLRALWERHGRTGIGVPEDGVFRIASELSGLDLSGFFARYVNGTDELPLAEALAAVGVKTGLRPAEGNKDLGGKPGKAGGKSARPGLPAQWLGARWSTGNDARLLHVFDGGPAQRAGLSTGDLVIAWNGLKLTGGNLQAFLERAAPASTAQVHAFRRDELMTFDVVLEAAPLDTFWFTLQADAAQADSARRDAWLHTTEPPRTA